MTEQLDIIIGGFVLFSSFFLHIIADFHVQGQLGDLKQESWWKDKCQELNLDFESYANDYRVCLFMHSFEWTYFMMLPMVFVTLVYYHIYIGVVWWAYCCLFALNVTTHMWVDDAKANWLTINLIWDQICHAIQVVGTWGIYVMIICVT